MKVFPQWLQGWETPEIWFPSMWFFILPLSLSVFPHCVQVQSPSFIFIIDSIFNSGIQLFNICNCFHIRGIQWDLFLGIWKVTFIFPIGKSDSRWWLAYLGLGFSMCNTGVCFAFVGVWCITLSWFSAIFSAIPLGSLFVCCSFISYSIFNSSGGLLPPVRPFNLSSSAIARKASRFSW